MDVQPTSPPSGTSDVTVPPQQPVGAVLQTNGPSAHPTIAPTKLPTSTRTLRTRPSDLNLKDGFHHSPTTERGPTQQELDDIATRMSKENVQHRRDELLKAKELDLKGVVEEHDDAVREKFHLERFISLLEGWDPEMAKKDNSPVFSDYKRLHYNLFDHAAPSSPQPSTAGPSRLRTPQPVRKTRRQTAKQSELFANVLPSSPATSGTPASADRKGKSRAIGGEMATPLVSSKSKRKSLQLDRNDEDTPSLKLKLSLRARAEEQGVLPAQIVNGGKKHANRAASMSTSEQEENPPSSSMGRKRGRGSLPTPAVIKKLRSSSLAEPSIEPSESASVDPEPEVVEAGPRTPSPPPQQPSLAHIAFPPFPPRPRERLYGPRQIWYTDPRQRPPLLQHDGDIAPIMESYLHLEDTGVQPDIKALELRAAREAYFRNRVNWLQHQGRLSRLLEEPSGSSSGSKTHPMKMQNLAPRQTDHHDSLLAHMVQVRNAILLESKSKPVVTKRIARMIQSYWEHIEGRAERERAAEEREQKRVMRDLIRAMRKRWSLAVKIVRARLLEAQKQEQDRLGKEHLQNMLQRSSGLLDVQRDEMAGERDDDDEDETDDEDSDVSHDTEDVSAASDDGAEDDQETDEDPGLEPSDESQDGKDLDGDEEPSDGGDLRDLIMDNITEYGNNSAMDIDNPSEKFEVPDQTSLDPAHTSEAIGLSRMDSPVNVSVPEPDSMEKSAMSDASVLPDAPAGPIQEMASLPDTLDDSHRPNGHDPSPRPRDIQTLSHSSPTPESEIDKPSPGLHSETATIPVPNGQAFSPETNGFETPRRPRRARKSMSLDRFVKIEDPNENDVDFDEPQSGSSERDQEYDEEMEAAEEDSSEDSEDAGLLADADIPIEDLLARYGYGGSVDQQDSETGYGAVNGISGNNHLNVDLAKPLANGEIPTDKSLLDDSFGVDPEAALILEGKRQRRVRSVWTPEDNPAPVRKPKIEEVEESDYEMTPSVSDSGDEGEKKGDDETDPNRVQPPFLLRGTLRPYQQAGLEWLASLYQNNMNGILADEMGLGKTIQTIALLGHLACDKGIWGQHLIIVPTSVILNWEMEFKKFLPGLKILTYYGNQKERKEKRKGWHTENAWQVCITSYQIVLADQHIFRRKSWVYMVLDEAHNIKNFRSQRWQTLLGFKAQRRLLLTGTPLQNNLMELWSLLYFLMPNGVTADATAVVGFANHKEFTEWFSNPMDKAVESGETMNQDMIETVAKLHTLLRPFILRRLKTEVETQLPGKFEHVVYCRLSKRQRFLYDEFMSRSSTKEALTSGGYLGVVNTLMQLRKVCNHPDLFEVRPVRTSFAMERSVAADFAPADLLVRSRLLTSLDDDALDSMNLRITQNEDQSAWADASRNRLDASDLLPHAVEPSKRGKQPAPPKMDNRTVEGWLKYREHVDQQQTVARWRSLRDVNRWRCRSTPIYGRTLLRFLSDLPRTLAPGDLQLRAGADCIDHFTPPAAELVHSLASRARHVAPLVDFFAMIPPNAVARDMPTYALSGLEPSSHPSFLDSSFDTLHQASVKLQIAFPDASLLQYDCGKLQKLYEMLRSLKTDGHRVLIFTQMTRVLDILEMFLSYNGHRYLRLDGSTKIEDRQIITERFNSDARIFCFIASSRSGGVGINLTGADTVFFYDSDWNPSMDRQCMDRAHRIGQTREVHIYRFVSSHTVEENMLKKANQKRLLDKVVIQEGDFTTDFFGKMDWRDVIDSSLIEDSGGVEEDRVEDVAVEAEPEAIEAESMAPRLGEERDFAKALAEVEDEEDAAAARLAQGEGELDVREFEEGPSKKSAAKAVAFADSRDASGTPAAPGLDDEIVQDADEEDEDGIGAVDEYVLRTVEWDWQYFRQF